MTENLTSSIKKYAKVRVDKDLYTEELVPRVLCDFGDHQFLDRILSRIGNIEFYVDEGYPSFWITLKVQDEFINVDQRDKFGFVDRSSETEMEDCILVFAESHFHLLHFFVIEGGFKDTSLLFESLKNNELNESIAVLLGDDQDVICEIQHAILNEREAERRSKIQLFSHYLKIAPIPSGTNFYINGLEANGDGFMSRFYGGDSVMLSYDKADPHASDYTLVLSNFSTTCKFSMKGVYGILSYVISNNWYFDGTVLVYHNLTADTYEFFTTRDLIDESPEDLFEMLENGSLNLELDRIIPNADTKRFYSHSDQYFQLLERVRNKAANKSNEIG